VTEEIHLNCTDAKSLMAGSSASNKLSRFFDKVLNIVLRRAILKLDSLDLLDSLDPHLLKLDSLDPHLLKLDPVNPVHTKTGSSGYTLPTRTGFTESSTY
jgi:hypothetical protein